MKFCIILAFIAGLLSCKTVKTPFYGPERLDAATGKRICKEPGLASLTFDDGPVLPNTELLVKILNENDVKGTFFVVGSHLEKADVAALIASAHRYGHTIANHTYEHGGLGQDIDSAQQQLLKTSQIIEKVAGESPSYMRPPFGTLPSGSSENLLAPLGLQAVIWNLDTADWRDENGTKEIVAAVEKMLSESDPRTDSFIVLQHDSHRKSVEAVPGVIAALRKANYRIVPLKECLGSPVPGMITTGYQ